MRSCSYASLVGSLGLALIFACNKSPEGADSKSAPEPRQAALETSERATIGALAPAFTLTDLDGKTVKLADHRGKFVVLEWFNPGCPFVNASHQKGSLVTTAKSWQDKGVVWLAINSSAQGKQGFGVEVNQAGKTKFNLSHPILLDPDGAVGKAYGAMHTPHMYVIDKDGKLAYQGAIDNSPDGEGDSPTSGALVNYVSQALEELSAGKPVSVSSTSSYGCGVKYAQ